MDRIKKPWLSEEGGLSLQGFLGAYGFETAALETVEEIIWEAARVYEIPAADTVAEMALNIAAIPKKMRRALAYKNITQGKRTRVSDSQLPDVPTSDDDIGPNHKEMLHDVVLALSNAGMGHLLADLPDVLAYFGSELPTVADLVGSRPPPELITGGITLDDKVWSFSCARVSRVTL